MNLKAVPPPTRNKTSLASIEQVDTAYLEQLIGYNARRAALSVIGLFMQRMSVYEMGPVDFSVLSLISHNAGITSRQLCSTLNILPPNLVGMINRLEKRNLIERQPHPTDGRATGLHLTEEGKSLVGRAEKTAAELEEEATSALTPAERKTLLKLLQKIYL